MAKSPTEYVVFNRITKRRDYHDELTEVFGPFKLITVLSDIKTEGKYEDDIFSVWTQEKGA